MALHAARVGARLIDGLQSYYLLLISRPTCWAEESVARLHAPGLDFRDDQQPSAAFLTPAGTTTSTPWPVTASFPSGCIATSPILTGNDYNNPRRHHHKYPMDFDRLVFPPAAAAIVIALFYWLLHALLPMVGWKHSCVGCICCSLRVFNVVKRARLLAAARPAAHGGLEAVRQRKTRRPAFCRCRRHMVICRRPWL